VDTVHKCDRRTDRITITKTVQTASHGKKYVHAIQFTTPSIAYAIAHQLVQISDFWRGSGVPCLPIATPGTAAASTIFTARRYALRGHSHRNSVRPSVCHTRGLCPHGSTYDHGFFAMW